MSTPQKVEKRHALSQCPVTSHRPLSREKKNFDTWKFNKAGRAIPLYPVINHPLIFLLFLKKN